MKLNKKCCRCNIEKLLEDFHNVKSRKGGKQYWCKECGNKSSQQYRQDNKEKSLQSSANWKENNKDKVRESNRKYITSRQKTDIQYKILNYTRSRIWELLKKKKTISTSQIFGCSLQQFKEHIEKQFTKEMTWENYGEKGWVLDHIKPCVLFNLEIEEDLLACFHFSNYQPLWNKENSKKGSIYNNKRYRKNETIS